MPESVTVSNPATKSSDIAFFIVLSSYFFALFFGFVFSDATIGNLFQINSEHFVNNNEKKAARCAALLLLSLLDSGGEFCERLFVRLLLMGGKGIGRRATRERVGTVFEQRRVPYEDRTCQICAQQVLVPYAFHF